MFEALINKLEVIARINPNQIIHDAIEDKKLQAQILDLQTEAGGDGQLHDKGIDSEGESLGEYAPITISFYKPLAASQGRDGKTSNITLKDTGTLYNSMRVENRADNFLITASDPNNLKDRFPKFLGLTEESVDKIRPEINDLIIETIKRRLNAA